MRNSIIVVGFAALLAGSACSSGARYKVDDATVADLPMSDKGELLQWQSNRDLAKGELDKARADAHTAEHEIVTAQTERGQAKLASQKLVSDIDLAKPRRDTALLGQLQNELGVAQLAQSAAETRVRLCKQQHEVNEAKIEAAKTHVSWAEAGIEQARARLVIRHGRLPSANFEVGMFDRQLAQAERENGKQQKNVMEQIARRDSIGSQYNQQLSMYSQRRSVTPSFSSSYTPPDYHPPQP